MANKQNLTVSLDHETIRSAKILAASRGTSISKLVAELVAKMIDEDRFYEQARVAAIADIERGFGFGGAGSASRDELHER